MRSTRFDRCNLPYDSSRGRGLPGKKKKDVSNLYKIQTQIVSNDILAIDINNEVRWHNDYEDYENV